ncbi:uncharacterized protein LOC142984861 [Anticarsia gemmatalis]|uniref:uncharacterized protein LOC142984861 n=1 Tax=Anticarsia gemmatalis TaxID=129554 RepID=UPI003F773D1A
MNFPMNWRDRRNILAPPHYPFASYCTDAKSEMKNTFADELFLNSLYLGPDPLRKNLADTIITEEKMAAKNGKNKLEKQVKEPELKRDESMPMHEDYSPLAGITNFFSGVLNSISNAMFSKRKPTDFSTESSPEMALPSMWHGAKLSDENKILQDENFSDDMSSEFFASEMSDCRAAAAHCKSKLEQVRVLLGSSKPVPCGLRARRRPKKVFVEPNSVEDSFEDAFSPEDFENLSNDSYVEFSSPVCYHEHVFHEIDGPKVKLEAAVVPDPPKVVPEAPKVVPEAPKVIPETPKVVPEAPKVEPEPVNISETPKSVLKTTEMVAEKPKTVVQSNTTVSEEPKLVFKPLNLVSDSPRMVDVPLVCETMDIVKNVPELVTKEETEPKKELVESCEDKLMKLKLLLQERRKKSKVVEPQPDPEPVPVAKLETEAQPLASLPPRPKPSNKVKDKRYKNPNRSNDKRRKSRMKKNIHDDMVFANELLSEDLSSVENSPSTNNLENFMKSREKTVQNSPPITVQKSEPKPVPQKEYFDEVSGRFHSASVDSEDSFQIVFNDSPKLRRASECDSEDSFIIFEDSPDSCYVSNDVFGDTTDSDEYDSDSDVSDSGCGTFKLSASLSKSVSNLADDSLYEDHSEDEVDCAKVDDLTLCESATVTVDGDNGCSKGLLLDERKKQLRKDLPVKHVHFDPQPPKVHVMRVWLFAAKQTRVRYWEQFVSDRDRFKRRIADVDMAVSWVLKPQHRSRVMFQRFMPWWNAQKRKELAEKKEREAREKLEAEERRKEEARQKEELEKSVSEKLPQDFIGLPAVTETFDSDTLVKDVNCQNGKCQKEKNKSALDNNDKILCCSDKILDLKPEYVGSVLNT